MLMILAVITLVVIIVGSCIGIAVINFVYNKKEKNQLKEDEVQHELHNTK